MSRYTGRRTYWCMDCNLYPVPGPGQQCEECAGTELDWDAHVAPLLTHWPEPAPFHVKPKTPARKIPAAADEVTYHQRVSVTP